MTKGSKVFVTLLLIFVIVLISIYFFVSVYFTPQRLKALVVPRLSERLGREVALKEIRFNLFKGLEVKKLAVKERPGLASEKFVLCDNLILKYKFWPLLRGRIEIGSLVLERPFIKIVKDKEGNFNFADITARFKKEKQEEKPAQPSANVKKRAVMAFFVSEVGIKDGEVLFKDLQTNREIHFTHFNLKASHIGLNRPFPLSLSTLVNEFLVKIDGEINPQTLAASLHVKASGDNFSSLMALFPQPLPLEITQGKLAAEGKISTDDMASFTGKLKLVLADIGLKTTTHDYSGLNIKLDTAFNYNLPANELTLHKGIIDFNETKLNVGGKVTPNWLNLRCKTPRIVLSGFRSFLPPSLGISSLKGEVALDVALAGNLAAHKLNAKGEISIQGVGGSLNSQLLFSDWQGEILLAKQDLIIPVLKGKVNEATLKLNGKLMHLLNQPFFNLNIEASNVNIEKLMALSFVSAETAKARGTNGKSVAIVQKLPPKTKPQVEPRPLNFPFSAGGQIKVKKPFYKQLVFSFLSTKYNLSQNVLTLRTIQGQLQKGGTIKGDVEVDLGKKGFAYKVNLQLDRIDVNNISFLIPSSVGTIQGKGSLNTQLKGQGITPPSLEKYLNGQAHLALTDGKFSGNPVWQSVAEFLDIDVLANPEFKAFNSTMMVESGKININGKADERDYGLDLKGQATVMGKLNLLARVRLNSSLVQHSKAKQLFAIVPKSKEGDYLIPLLIKGEIKAPKVTLDKKAVKAAVKEKLEELLEEKLPLKNIPFFK
ncbi:MAG: AsmA family protein [Candidatus Desulfofervidaceae bacterium]|nr:AsmA family protein [Candidatus Desulfofervidaceae bacterium]